ncbi:MAG: ABC transporter substrate-binding protein [Deltaproteobacteria bacterium]|nr:ABC transporter substrate-binding protein [Deltaproteobacteria bacterium]
MNRRRSLKVLMLGMVLGIVSLFCFSPALGAPPIKIGMITDLTGMAYTLAKPNVDGAQMAADEINKAGGLLGRKIEILVRDSALKTDLGIAAARELILDQKVNFMFGPVSSAVRLAISDLCKMYKVPLIDTIGGSRRLNEDRGHDYFWQMSLSTRTEAGGQAIGTAKIKGVKTICTISPDYEWGRMEYEGFMEPFKKLRPEVQVLSEFWPKLGEKDYTTYITAIIAKKPDLLWSALWGGDSIAFVKQAKPYGLFEKMKFVGTGELGSIMALGKEGVPGTYGWDRAPFYAIQSPKIKPFIDAWKAKTGRWPEGWVILGYDGVLTVKHGIEKAGKVDAEAWVKAMKGETVPLLHGTIKFRHFDNLSNSPVYFGLFTFIPEYPFLAMKPVEIIDTEPIFLPVEEVKKLREAAK